MNFEAGFLKAEQKEAPKNAIDEEFDSLESDFDFEDRLEITREMFDDVYNPPLMRKDYYECARHIEANGEGEIKHYYLPGIPGGETGEMNEIREGYGNRAEYLKSDERMFVRIGQGEMWRIPKSENPYFKITISECSAIIGESEEEIVVAHVSYSTTEETEAVMKFLKEREIDPSHIRVIASTGEYQKKRKEEGIENRIANIEEYEKLGIPKENIIEFEYSLREANENGLRGSKNLTQVLGNKDGVFKYSFDTKRVQGAGFRMPSEEKDGEYKNEVAVKF